MELNTELVEFFKNLIGIALAIIIALVFVFRLLWPKVERTLMKTALLKAKGHDDKTAFRNAAIERLLLLTLRMEPKEVLMRNYKGNMSVSELKNASINDVENEFQYNITQQLYVSQPVWDHIAKLKQVTVDLLANSAGDQPVDSYVSDILQTVAQMEDNVYVACQQMLKNQLK